MFDLIDFIDVALEIAEMLHNHIMFDVVAPITIISRMTQKLYKETNRNSKARPLCKLTDKGTRLFPKLH